MWRVGIRGQQNRRQALGRVQRRQHRDSRDCGSSIPIHKFCRQHLEPSDESDSRLRRLRPYTRSRCSTCARRDPRQRSALRGCSSHGNNVVEIAINPLWSPNPFGFGLNGWIPREPIRRSLLPWMQNGCLDPSCPRQPMASRRFSENQTVVYSQKE